MLLKKLNTVNEIVKLDIIFPDYDRFKRVKAVLHFSKLERNGTALYSYTLLQY